MNALGYLLLLGFAVYFFYADIFFLGVASVALLVILVVMDYSQRRRASAARTAALRAMQARQEEEEEDEYDEDEYEEEKILIRNKVGKIPGVMRLRIKPKSKRRNTWEMTAQDVGDIADTVFGSVFRLFSGAHEHEGKTPWDAGRGR